ncbi:MAG: hypothetical protein P8186_13075 [Anaerolineae bacterium]|jgi:hypothetical protein
MTDEKSITLSEAIFQVVDQLDGPITVSEFADRVLAIYPSKTKNPAARVRAHLRQEEDGASITYLDRQTILPLRMAMKGVRFRIPITRQEATQGMLFIEPTFFYFLRRGIGYEDVQLANGAGHAVAVHVVTLTQRASSLFGRYTQEIPAFELRDWFRANRVRRNDSILVTIEDWELGRFRLEHEPARRRHRGEIERKNQELADLLFGMLESARNEQIYAQQAIPAAYARLSDPRGYPGDHWFDVLEQDPRMKWDGFAIRYSESRTFFDRMLSPEDETRPEMSYTPAQANQVYRFKAALWHRAGLWRRIETQGKQTLADFDHILRRAFEHDMSDHLGGFWKRVRRGTGKRFREVDLGDIDPFGGGSGADSHVAGLGLNPGDELKYVYDFGDWIEHRISLEKVVEPEAKAKYPRIVGQNKPRYRYCQSCQAKGRQTVASWICIECSNEQQEEVLVCRDCLLDEHEDHYAEEILY